MQNFDYCIWNNIIPFLDQKFDRLSFLCVCKKFLNLSFLFDPSVDNNCAKCGQKIIGVKCEDGIETCTNCYTSVHNCPITKKILIFEHYEHIHCFECTKKNNEKRIRS